MKTARATDPLGQRSMLEMSEQDLERGEGSKAEDNKLVGAAMGAVPKAIFAPPSDAEEAEQTEPSVLVRTQTASCPDAQCPRAKMENVGYFAKGYNIYYGNPMTTEAGVDPGFTDHAGGLIWKLEYNDNLETADGRYQIPDKTIVEHNHGCSLSMTTTTSSSESELQEEYEDRLQKALNELREVYDKQMAQIGRAHV